MARSHPQSFRSALQVNTRSTRFLGRRAIVMMTQRVSRDTQPSSPAPKSLESVIATLSKRRAVCYRRSLPSKGMLSRNSNMSRELVQNSFTGRAGFRESNERAHTGCGSRRVVNKLAASSSPFDAKAPRAKR